MRTPKSFIRTRLFEICRTIFIKPRKGVIEFYHKRLAWWMDIYGVRFKHTGFYIIFKRICF